jgi:Mn-dependent DtxR family transcriptional regulator
MSREEIPDEVRRFVQTAVPSVPYAEALLLFLSAHDGELETVAVARRLYITDPAATALVEELRAAGVVAPGSAPGTHVFAPRDGEHERLLRLTARYYTTHLIDVTELIHSSTARHARRFADAFKFRKEP